MAEARSSRFVRDSLGFFGAQVIVTALGIVTSVITARTLGPHDRGLFQLLILLPTTLSNFVKFGIPQANVYFIRRRGVSASDIASNSLWLGLGLGTALALLCWVERDWMLAKVLKEVPVVTLPPVLALVPVMLIQVFFLGVIQAEERFREYNIQNVAPVVLGLVG